MTVVDTVVVSVVVVVESVVVCAAAGTAQATSAPTASATVIKTPSLRAGFTTVSLALLRATGNTANMLHAGKRAPPFSPSVWTWVDVPARVAEDVYDHRHSGDSIGLVGPVP